MARTESN